MAAKRSSSAKGKSASGRSSGGRRSGGGGGGFGGFFTKLVLYPLAIVGGLYLGVQAHAVYGNGPLPIPWPDAGSRGEQVRREAPARTKAAGARHARREEQEWPRSRSTRREEERQRTKVAEPDSTDDAPGTRSEEPEPAAPARDSASIVPPKPEPESTPAPAKPEETVTVRPVSPTSTKAAPVPAVEIDRGTGERPEVALTFDAGSDYRPAAQILDTLAAEGIRCTFFLTGEWVQRNPKTSRRIAADGHEIGNHSWDHPPFTQLSTAEIQDQVRRTETIIKATTGHTSRPYFRPPLGARDQRVRQVVGSEGFLTVYWSLDSRDSVDRGITGAQIRDRVLTKAGPGSIVLLHCGSQATADALPEILKGLKSRGLTPVALSRLLAE